MDDDAPLVGGVAFDIVRPVKAVQQPKGGGGRFHNMWGPMADANPALLTARGATQLVVTFADPVLGTGLLDTIFGADGSPHLDDLSTDDPVLECYDEFEAAPKWDEALSKKAHSEIMSKTNLAKNPTLGRLSAGVAETSIVVSKYEPREYKPEAKRWERVQEWTQSFAGSSLELAKPCRDCGAKIVWTAPGAKGKPVNAEGESKGEEHFFCHLRADEKKKILDKLTRARQLRASKAARAAAATSAAAAEAAATAARAAAATRPLLALARPSGAAAAISAGAAAATAALAAVAAAAAAALTAATARVGAVETEEEGEEEPACTATTAPPAGRLVTEYVCAICEKPLKTVTQDGGKMYMRMHKPWRKHKPLPNSTLCPGGGDPAVGAAALEIKEVRVKVVKPRAAK